MDFDEQEIQEFKSEAEELILDAEARLLKMEQEPNYDKNYSAVFRALHSLKGASGMLGLEELRTHMHKLENIFHQFKESTKLSQDLVTFFLKGLDAARSLLAGRAVSFSFEPVTSLSSPEAEEITSNKILPVGKPKQKLIYIIDDEEDNLEIISSMIKTQDFRYECFLSSEEAVAKCEDFSPDLILTDMKMPGMNGLDVLKKMKTIDSEIPIIFISGHLDKSTLMEALNLGVFAVLDKPIKENQLINFITQAVARRDMWRLLNRSIDLVLFQVNDMENYLLSQNKPELVEIMKQDARQLLESRRALKNPKN